MNLPQQFASENQPPILPLRPADTPAASSDHPQPIRRVVSSDRTPSDALTRWQPFTSWLPSTSVLDVFEELLGRFLEARPVTLNIPGSSDLPREFPHLSWRPVDQEVHQGSVPSGLDQVYVLEDRSSVLNFVKRNRLLELLLAARDPLASAFGETAIKRLTLVEDDEGFVTLFCLILTRGGSDEAQQALNSFDESWWLDHSYQGRGKLNFDFELV